MSVEHQIFSDNAFVTETHSIHSPSGSLVINEGSCLYSLVAQLIKSIRQQLKQRVCGSCRILEFAAIHPSANLKLLVDRVDVGDAVQADVFLWFVQFTNHKVNSSGIVLFSQASLLEFIGCG